jgi:hypothetical protein
MGLISEGIEKVLAFALPMSIGEDGRSLSVSRDVIVKWKSKWNDKFHQVYVNGRFAGVTSDTEQRQIVAGLPTSFLSSVRIEIFAVEGCEADIDFGDCLAGSRGKSGRVRLNLLRDQKLAIDSGIEIFSDYGSGQIDMTSPINKEKLWMWSAREDKAGFGLSGFGLSDFGYDWSGAIGLGKGCFGAGQFGCDSDLFEWVSGQLNAGVYKFAVRILSEDGRESLAVQTGEITVLPSARGIEELTIKSFDKLSNELILNAR